MVKQARPAPRRRGLPVLAACVVLAAAVLAGCGEGSTGAGSGGRSTDQTVRVLAFKPPSLGAFLPAVIESRKIDSANGIDMQFTYTTPDNYNAEFGAGHFDVGGSAALLSEALRTERDANVTYLFNLFDFFGAVVTSKDGVQSLGDLEGKKLAAATGTTNFAMFQWFAKQQGLDLDKVEKVNQTTAGLSSMAASGRTDGTQLWEPAYSTLLAKNKDVRTLDLGLSRWQSTFHTDSIPYLGVAAKGEWAKAHADTVKKMFAVYKEAADWVRQNPDDAAKIIAKDIPNGDPAVIAGLIRNNDKLGLAVAPADQVADGIDAVFKAGEQTGYLKQDPPESIVYKGL